MSDDTTEQPKVKRPNEVDVLRRVDGLLNQLPESAARRVAFYFADKLGLHVQPPVNGNG